MKKAKIVLTCVAILAVVGGALAFKAMRLPANIYSLLAGNKVASITVGTVVYTTTIPNCTLTTYHTVAEGGVERNLSSTTTAAASTTIFRSGANQVITTFPYCTLWVTKVVPSDGD
jgi:hypothetical protein